MARVAEEQFGWFVFQYASAVHEQHARSDVTRELHFVRDHQHRHAFVGQRADHLQNFADQLWVQGRRGLIEQHQHRAHRHGAGEGHPLLLAARQLRRSFHHVIG